MADHSLPKVAERSLPDAAMANVTHVRVVSTDNSEKLPIENLTLAGTKVTVAVDGLPGTVDGAFEDVLTKIAGKADTAQVEALDEEKLDIANVYNALDKTVEGFALDARQGKALDGAKENIADLKAVFPASAYFKRVAADSGVTFDRGMLLQAYGNYLKQLPETRILLIPELGAKLRTSGLNRFGVKAYDMSANAKDAVQLTDATQPYMTVGAAPNARLGMRFVQGQTQTGLMDFDDVVFAAGDSWTLTAVIKSNKGNTSVIYLGGATRLHIGLTEVSMFGQSDALLLWAASPVEAGKTHIYEFQYSNGVGLIKKNNIPLATAVYSQAAMFGQISPSTINMPDGSLYALHLTNTRKSEAQSQLDHTFLSTLFPDIESVTIGNQVWATSNFEGIVAGDGTVIPEVQSAATAADATNIYNATYAATTGSAAVKDLAATKAAAMWCHYDNLAANGAVYGKLYNWYAVHLFDLYPPVKGWRVPSTLDFDQLVAVNGGSTVAGRRLKAKFGGFDNANASNESGFSMIAGGARGVDGLYAGINFANRMWSTDKNLRGSQAGILAFENGWNENPIRMMSVRLLRNEPAGQNELSYTSGLFTTNITSAAKQIPISFGRTVDYIRIKSENSLTAIEAKLHNAAGTAVATLITGKTIGAGETKMFAVTADWVSLLQDGTIRVTAAGNSGAAVGMEIEVLTHKGVLS